MSPRIVFAVRAPRKLHPDSYIDQINIIILMIIITITMRRPPVLCYPLSLGDLLDWARRLASATITVCVPLARQMTTKTTRR